MPYAMKNTEQKNQKKPKKHIQPMVSTVLFKSNKASIQLKSHASTVYVVALTMPVFGYIV